jgi:hypothetical protein
VLLVLEWCFGGHSDCKVPRLYKFKVCKALSFTRFRFQVQGVSQRSVYFSLFYLEDKPGYIY